MLLSAAFLLALFSTLCNDSQLLEVSSKKLDLTSNRNLESMDRKLTLIRRAQLDQQRKILYMELRLSSVLSKLNHLIHIKHPESFAQLSASLDNALERLEIINKQLIDKLEELTNQQLKHDHIQNLEHVHLLQNQLLVDDKCCQQKEKHRELNNSNEKLETSVNNTQIERNKKDTKSVAYNQPAKADCYELDEQQRVDGVYKFLEPELNEVQRNFNERYCAFATSGPAWTLIQRRSNEIVNREHFNRSWDEYRAGFGSLSKDFWFGNEFIHKIVYRDDYMLRIELEDQLDEQVWAEYGLFRLDSDSYNYQLVLGKLYDNSTALDALVYHNNMEFRTFENNESCNGWWFGRCQEAKSNLNAPNIIWGNWHNEYSLKASRMLIRPRNSNIHITDDTYDEDFN